MTSIDIVLERETANDETALVVAIHAASGAPVVKDELVFEIENSKATQELRAPIDGVISHTLAVGQTIEFGVAIARVEPLGEDAEPPAADDAKVVPTAGAPDRENAVQRIEAEALAGAAALRKHGGASARFSRAALALIEENGLSKNAFDAGFVTKADVASRLGVAPVARVAVTSRRGPKPSATLGRPVSPGKRVEIDMLQQGAGANTLSVIGVTTGPIRPRRESGHFLSNAITDLVVYEASRLMRIFPTLNAYYADGRVVLHDAVHAGMAIDGGGRLVVLGLEDTDRAQLTDIAAAMEDGVARYVDNALTGSELSRATFTVTDLSGENIDFVFPLLPRGQSCILGVTRGEKDGYRIFAAFDHRVSEGREVAKFLGELRARLESFDRAQHEKPDVAHCLYCDRSATEAIVGFKERGLLRIVDKDGRDAFCCASCWNGW